jgi:alkylhydroperoxidase family enzyme
MKGKKEAWIQMIEEEDASGELKGFYDELRDPETGQVDNILRIHGLHPETLHAHYLLYKTVMYGKSKIRRPDREMIAVVVSSLNECHY